MPQRLIAICLLPAIMCAGMAAHAADRPKRPAAGPSAVDSAVPPADFAEIEKVLAKHLQAGGARKASGKLVSRGDLEKLLPELERAGWKPGNSQALLGRTLPESSTLVKELRTTEGKQFLRHLEDNPAAYDRLDRLSGMPSGDRRVRELVRGPDGHKLLDYMTRDPGGKELGKMLGQAPGGRNFNQPTGRIYTAEQLQQELKNQFEAEHKRPSERRQPAKRVHKS